MTKSCEVLTLAIGIMGAEFLDELEDLALHLDLILVANAVLTQKVKADGVRLRKLHILQLHCIIPGSLSHQLMDS